jgi:hypothetical protein
VSRTSSEEPIYDSEEDVWFRKRRIKLNLKN